MADGALVAQSFVDTDATIQTHTFDPNYLGLFAWAEDKLFLATANRVTTRPLRGSRSVTSDIPPAESTEDMFAITDAASDTRLLLRRKSNDAVHLYMYKPEGGSIEAINLLIPALPEPQVAIADGKLILWMQDQKSSKIYTYNL